MASISSSKEKSLHVLTTQFHAKSCFLTAQNNKKAKISPRFARGYRQPLALCSLYKPDHSAAASAAPVHCILVPERVALHHLGSTILDSCIHWLVLLGAGCFQFGLSVALLYMY